MNIKTASIGIAAATAATGAFAGVVRMGVSMGSVLGTVVSLPFGIETSVGSGALVVTAAVALVAGIAIIRRKQGR